MQLRWSHAVLHVRNLDVMLDFYTRVLGFTITDRGPLGGSEIVFLSQVETDHHQLAFVPARRGDAAASPLNHFAFRVDGLDDVRAVARRVQQDGRGSTPRPVTHGNAWSVYFGDPERNGIEVFCDTPWHVTQPQGGAWDMSQDNETVLAQTRAQFEREPGFQPAADFLAAHAQRLRTRG
jgi:catechol-2,3-dioxygenase